MDKDYLRLRIVVLEAVFHVMVILVVPGVIDVGLGAVREEVLPGTSGPLPFSRQGKQLFFRVSRSFVFFGLHGNARLKEETSPPLLNRSPKEGSVLRFDHLTHHVPDLSAAIEAYTDHGFQMTVVRTDPRQGTTAAFSRNGRTYWELIGVNDIPTFERQQALRQERYPNLAFTTTETVRAGGGITSFAIEVTDLDETVTRLRTLGQPIAEPVRRGTQTPSGKWGWSLAGPTEGPPWLPFFIEYATPGEERLASLPVSGWIIDHLVLETAQPAASGQRLSALLALPLTKVSQNHYVIPLSGAPIHLVSGMAERISTVVLRTGLPAEREIAGVRLLPAR